MRYKEKRGGKHAAERRGAVYLENRWIGKLYMQIEENDNPRWSGVPASAHMEFAEGEAVGHINEYHLAYAAPGECRGMKRLAVRVFVVCAWSCVVAVCATVRHGLMDRWAKQTGPATPALEGNEPGLHAA